MRYSVFIISLVFLTSSLRSQPPSFAAATIPDALKQQANVVIRYQHSELTISNINKASLKVHRIITVLNEKGRHALYFTQYTTKHISLNNAEVKVYDAAGKLISRHKKRDMQSSAIGEGLVEDGYMTYYPVITSTYPVTIESEYELEIEGTLNLPRYIICGENEGVEYSTFIAKVPTGLGFRYKSRNIDLQPLITEADKEVMYQWTVKDRVATEREEGAVSAEDRVPAVVMTTDNFSFYGHAGNLSSWKNFGLWISNLYAGLDELPSEKKEYFKLLVLDAVTDREKARILYGYLQKNFRYVSIQLGIGGLKPFSAQFTDQKKYGDCKALSNYMRAALNAVGVKSYLGIINAGYNNEPVDPSFPLNDFNHVILCIPGTTDSLWLECTSSTTEFGHLGTFTENRNALLITESGGVLVSTPRSQAASNRFALTTKIDLTEDGSGSTETFFRGTGAFNEQLDDIHKAKPEDQKKALVLGLGFKQPDDFEFEKIFNTRATPHWRLIMTVEKIPEFSAGSKLFLAPRLYKLWSKKLPGNLKRNHDYYFHFPFELSDTTVFKLPEGYKPEVIPPAKTINSLFGEYKTNYWFDEERKWLYSTATLILNQHRIPAAGYADLKRFSEAIMEDEATRLVIKRQ